MQSRNKISFSLPPRTDFCLRWQGFFYFWGINYFHFRGLPVRKILFAGSDSMTQAEKERIADLQLSGFGYRKIAAELGMSVDTIKSFCRRRPLPHHGAVCAQCGKPLVQIPHKKKKRFCCDQCRMTWWKAHPDQIVRKKVYAHTCLNCRDVFHSHRANSQYCSRKCFSESRRSEVRK